MCGRFTRKYTWEEVFRLLEGKALPPGFWETIHARWEAEEGAKRFDFDSYNVAPTHIVPVIREREGRTEIAAVRWGLVPSWAEDEKIGASLINARAETAAEKPAFRAALKKRRLLVPASGFFEWQRIDAKTKQPFYFSPADGKPILFAGLWEMWGETRIETFTILTTGADKVLEPVHHRMPVMLRGEEAAEWMASETTEERVAELILQRDSGLAGFPVSKAVGNVANNDASLVVPVARETLF